MSIPSRQQPLNDWIEWLLHLHPTEIDLGLKRVRSVAERMGLLTAGRLSRKVMTVAGTNGKGSSVAMLSAIYDAAGYRVGSYTSPHLLRFNERIQINQAPVDDQMIIDAFAEIEVARGETKLTYFEFSTLAALKIFAEAALDVVVLEVGLGGRLDAVNIVDADVALITAIDVDHIDWLGDDRSQIAIEKAAILRANQWAACSDPNPPQTLAETARAKQANLFQLGKHFKFSQNPQSCQDEYRDLDNAGLGKLAKSWDFVALDSALQSVEDLPVPALAGDFQLQNAAGVLAALQGLQADLPVSEKAIHQGLRQVKHLGRLQWLKVAGQDWLLDVAHNPQSAGVLADYLQQTGLRFSDAVFSVLADKDSLPMVKQLVPFVEHWHIAPLVDVRALDLERLQQLLQQAGVADECVSIYPDVATAVNAVQTKGCERVLALGSFFTVGAVLSALSVMGSSDE